MKEFSFLIGNCPGSLVEIAEVLGAERVNIEGIGGATVLEEGVVGLVTDDPGKTRKVLREAEIDFEEHEALAIDLPNHPSELATLLRRLADERINVLSCYAAVERNRLILTVDDVESTKRILHLE
ncbi:MAG: hypothetical protein JSW65_01585 [Candidatus Bipolaricaulota bacterium]|nr:MAG: hypothetical protein JSW65_01585 [Candidatus Bipolaricaulota bacterium]